MKLCIALDLPSKKENLSLIDKLQDFDNIWYKVGFRSFIRDGKDFLQEIKNINKQNMIFLDLKLHDIPNTMADASYEIANMGLVDMFNIHASSGKKAMDEVILRMDKLNKRPLILAVTALTSFDNNSFKEIYKNSIQDRVKKFAIDAYKSGIDGVVCSAYESKVIKSYTSDSFLTLTPGIRLNNNTNDDQARVATPTMAKQEMVDFIVVGRPIYKSSTPQKVVSDIINLI
jgi:orotidine-5'-phosphate decarboxylase